MRNRQKFRIPANSLSTILKNKSDLLNKYHEVLLHPIEKDFVFRCILMKNPFLSKGQKRSN